MKPLLALLLSGSLFVLSACAPLPSFVPFETEGEVETESAQSTDTAAAETPPTLTFDGRRYSFDGDPDALRAEDERLILQTGGTYRLSGILLDGCLTVEADPADTVCLILDGLSLTAASHPCIQVSSAAALVIRTASGSANVLRSDKASAIESQAPLILEGEGTLSLRGATDGIDCEGDLTCRGGRVTVSAKERGLFSGRRLTLSGGSLTVNGPRWGLCTEEAKGSDGGICITGGALTVLATAAALKAVGQITVTGGKGSLDAPKFYDAETVTVRTEEFPTWPG